MQTSRSQQAVRTKQAILETARRLFAERGFDATSLQVIADDMGVRKANVYYYFKTKGAILTALLKSVTEPMAALLDSLADIDDPDERKSLLVKGFASETVRSYRESGSMNLSDPGLFREPEAAAVLEDLGTKALRILFGDNPTPDQRAAFWLVFDLAPVLRRLDDLSDDQLRETIERLLWRVVGDV
ncbi:putative TetR family transcriptional regulator [Gordonia effusa NBRC 100432]|uniref:Putative TetR family transcriptional regulator n=1 Tax=Gordonia effusa NBRC 100432 TaxID=1077974 RepID=H0R0W4_9ACTN|nr:TetR/AcrR family transcriptional regulator [Gordonia effusa]GAB18715.1 putative TetR family transcriptional regulator [Gordonia effusa NBRC 100432]